MADADAGARDASVDVVPGDAAAPVDAATRGDPVLVGAGDIACALDDTYYNGGSGDPMHCRQRYTADVIASLNPTAVFTLGDDQYDNGTLPNFRDVYDPTWGRFRSITHPAVGNHEYANVTPSVAQGYRDYFGAAATSNGGHLYYSWQLGRWHIVVLDSNCTELPGGCAMGGAEQAWLDADLAANRQPCVLAYWHHARFSDMGHGDHGPGNTDAPGGDVSPFWDTLYAHHADLVLNGHDHGYERFAPMDTRAVADPAAGLREFIVGTGGKNDLALFASPLRHPAVSEFRDDNHFGVLRLVLHPGSYDASFVVEPGAVLDTASGTCHPK